MNMLAASQTQAVCRPSAQEHGATRASVMPFCGREKHPVSKNSDNSERFSSTSLLAARKSPPFTASRKVSNARARVVTLAVADSAPKTDAEKPKAEELKIKKVISVALKTDLGIEYAPLEAALKEGNFRQADDITRALLIVIAGDDAESREFVYFTEVKSMPVNDLQTIDNLWTAYSEGKFGYSVQKKMWRSSKIKEKWGKFFKILDWTVGENNSYRSWANNEYIYNMEAVKGHLPLTSCLRGTQLLRGLLEHPAFENGTGVPGGAADVPGAAPKIGGKKPDWLKF